LIKVLHHLGLHACCHATKYLLAVLMLLPMQLLPLLFFT
jgi:hypothetical protein